MVEVQLEHKTSLALTLNHPCNLIPAEVEHSVWTRELMEEVAFVATGTMEVIVIPPISFPLLNACLKIPAQNFHLPSKITSDDTVMLSFQQWPDQQHHNKVYWRVAEWTPASWAQWISAWAPMSTMNITEVNCCNTVWQETWTISLESWGSSFDLGKSCYPPGQIQCMQLNSTEKTFGISLFRHTGHLNFELASIFWISGSDPIEDT